MVRVETTMSEAKTDTKTRGQFHRVAKQRILLSKYFR